MVQPPDRRRESAAKERRHGKLAMVQGACLGVVAILGLTDGRYVSSTLLLLAGIAMAAAGWWMTRRSR